ncbi:hypothetical protein SDC9_172693 [bioreactor metagenome]|uniref:Uncharacterized protein n=1 Tax=bioreactor metagenome TaxID=1076179 RepID=A0A645GGI7_9ZZZZ
MVGGERLRSSARPQEDSREDRGRRQPVRRAQGEKGRMVAERGQESCCPGRRVLRRMHRILQNAEHTRSGREGP